MLHLLEIDDDDAGESFAQEEPFVDSNLPILRHERK